MRYAETNSFERDGVKPNAWKYRDYVIRSLNDDKPYDQFLREQLAGDELDEVTDDSIIATGYYRLGIWDDEPADPVQARYDEWDDIISTTSQAMLGLTVGCARCHDHKIDPIPQADYYGLLAFFADVTPYGNPRRSKTTNSQWDLSSPEEAALRQALREKESEIEREKTSMEEVGIKRMPAADQRRSETPEREKLLDEKLRPVPQCVGVAAVSRDARSARGGPRQSSELAACGIRAGAGSLRCPPRADAHHGPRQSARAGRRGRAALSGAVWRRRAADSTAADDARSAGRRRVLAEWIASPRNMLTARVIVNRVWQHHFGRGIVRSANNFGELGTPPTHPELLDWLALWLIDHNWQLKPLHRLIMTSSAYRMSSAADDAGAGGRSDQRSVLAVRHAAAQRRGDPRRDAGRHRRVQSENVRPELLSEAVATEVLATQSRPGDGWGRSSRKEAARRSIYMFMKRSLLPPLLTAFDFPDVDTSCEARFVTTQPGQALALLNGEFANAAAAKLADRVVAEAGDEPQRQLARAFELALNRPPDRRRNRRRPGTRFALAATAWPIAARRARLLVPDRFESDRVRVSGLRSHSPIIDGRMNMKSNPTPRNFCGRTRREFLWETGCGFGAAALTSLLAGDGFLSRAGAASLSAASNPLAPKSPPLPAKAKSVIFLFMYGGPSHIDTFDYKPDDGRHGRQDDRRENVWPRRTQEPGPHRRAALEVPPVRPVRQMGQRAVSRTWATASTTSHSCIR